MKRPDAIQLVLVLMAVAAGGYLISSGCKDLAPPPGPPAKRAAPPPGGAPTVPMRIGTGTFNLEMARTDRERQLGLMYRESMPADHGMIFTFEDERRLGFYMRNTKIPLDIIYVDAGGRVVSTHKMYPLEERSVLSKGPAKYAIELNQGTVEKIGVKEGDVLVIPEAAREP